MAEPGFYRLNPRALRLRELARMRGWLWAPVSWCLIRTRAAPTIGGGMPQSSRDLTCTHDDLSAQFWEVTHVPRATLERLGFRECRLVKVRPDLNLNDVVLDHGGITYLHANGAHVGAVVYARSWLGPPINRERHTVVVNLAAAFGATMVACSNSRESLDPPPSVRVTRLRSADPEVLYGAFLRAAARQAEQPRVFESLDALDDYLDRRAVEQLEEHVRRGLYVKMTDSEVEAARRKLQGTAATRA